MSSMAMMRVKQMAADHEQGHHDKKQIFLQKFHHRIFPLCFNGYGTDNTQGLIDSAGPLGYTAGHVYRYKSGQAGKGDSLQAVPPNELTSQRLWP